MTIEDPERWAASAPDWAILDGCFSGRIKPSDVDGFVEHNGTTLFLEHKSTPNAQVKMGQHIAYRSWANQGNAVLVFWSEGGAANVKRIRVYWGNTIEDREGADLDELRATCTRWFKHAHTRGLADAA